MVEANILFLLVSLSCGGTASTNNTYLDQSTITTLSSTTYPGGNCAYSVCPCSTDICRIRYDFKSFVIDNPVQIASLAPATVGNEGMHYAPETFKM